MFAPIKIASMRALHDFVVVSDMNFGDRTTSSGLVMLNDNGRTAGVRPRWARVYAIGPDQQDVSVGQWVLVSHGRWTRGVKVEDQTGEHVLRRIDHKDILLVSDAEMNDDTQSSASLVDSKQRW